MLHRISAAWARVELAAAAAFGVAVTLLILLNVVTRSLGAAIYWVDELAIYSMVWMAFLGASASLHRRDAVAITMLRDAVPARLARALSRAVDAFVAVFAVAMLYFCWIWFLPLDLLRAGFDLQTFQGETFNFVYAEPTTTLGIPKWQVWSVMWLFSAGALLHAMANLAAPLPARPARA